MVSIAVLATTPEFAAAVDVFDKDSINGIWEFEKFEQQLSIADWNTLQNWLLDGGPDQWTTNVDNNSSTIEQLLTYCREKEIESTTESKTTIDSRCVACNKTTNLLFCGNCRRVGYCSKDCQRRDWATHKHVCEKR